MRALEGLPLFAYLDGGCTVFGLQKSSQWTLMLHPCVYVLNKHFRVNKPNLDFLLER